MNIHGKAFRYGRDVNTDVIIPARYLNTSDPAELAAHAMEDLDPTFVEKVEPAASTPPSRSRPRASAASSPRATRASSTATPSTWDSPSSSAMRRSMR